MMYHPAPRFLRILELLLQVTIIIVGVAGIFLVVVETFKLTHFIQGVFEEIVVGLLSAGLFVAGLERLLSLKPIEQAVFLTPDLPLALQLKVIEETASQANRLRALGVSAFYANRRALPPLADFLSAAKDDLLIHGLSADALIIGYHDLIEDRLRNGCNVRFLLPKALEKGTIAHLASSRDTDRTSYHLADTLSYLTRINADVRSTTAGKLEVKLYDFVITLGLIMIDGAEPHGKIRVELFPYKSPVANRPSFELVRVQRDNDMYSYFKSQYDLLWNEAEEWVPENKQAH